MRRLAQALTASAFILLLSASTVHAQISVDVHIGQPPPPPRAYRVPPAPGPEFVWVEGYWYPQGRRYAWHNGYWTRPPYAGAYWVAPYYREGQYFAGRWQGGRGNVFHDHRWDKNKRRDERREPRDRDRRDR